MEKEQKNIIQIYAVYLISIICNFIPSGAVSGLGSILFIIIFIATYIYKARAEEDSLTKNHMRYILKSIWISSLLLIVGIIAAYLFGDHSLIHQTMEGVKQGMFLTEEQINSLMMDYMMNNLLVFCTAFLPSLIYLFYRLAKGLVKAKENLHIENLKNWL